tara:strand:+ start:660 stop:1151 length:492 start_codon:yes stop_codon:yes gene_type:complete
MSKIKLLILLLINFTIASCLSNTGSDRFKISVAYIGGEYDGLILSNLLNSQLNNFGMLDRGSKYEVQADISHSQNLYITNLDNTSDRENINSSINIKIYDKELKCYTHTYSETVSQFYILAPSDQFISNSTAVEEIKIENTEYLTKKFVNNLSEEAFVCIEQE